MDWPIGFASNESLTIDFKKETLLNVYPGIERIPSLKKRVGTEIGASFFIIDVETLRRWRSWSYCIYVFLSSRSTSSQISVNMLERPLLIAIQLWGLWDFSLNPSFTSLFLSTSTRKYSLTPEHSDSWSIVTLAFFLRYPNPYASHVISCDVISRDQTPSGSLVTTRLILKRGAMPRWFPKGIVSRAESWVVEESEVDPHGKLVRCVTKNLDHVKVMQVEESVQFAQTMEGSVPVLSKGCDIFITINTGKLCNTPRQGLCPGLDGDSQKKSRIMDYHDSRPICKEYCSIHLGETYSYLASVFSLVKEWALFSTSCGNHGYNRWLWVWKLVIKVHLLSTWMLNQVRVRKVRMYGQNSNHGSTSQVLKNESHYNPLTICTCSPLWYYLQIMCICNKPSQTWLRFQLGPLRLTLPMTLILCSFPPSLGDVFSYIRSQATRNQCCPS